MPGNTSEYFIHRTVVWPRNSPGQNTGVGTLFPSPGDLPNPGIEPRSSALQADSLPTKLHRKPHSPAKMSQVLQW